VVVLAIVHLVGDLDEDVGVGLLAEPVGGVLGGAEDGVFVAESLVLAEVEDPQDGGHAESVGGVEDPLQAGEVIAAQLAVGLEGGVVPGLVL